MTTMINDDTTDNNVRNDDTDEALSSRNEQEEEENNKNNIQLKSLTLDNDIDDDETCLIEYPDDDESMVV